MKDQVIRRKSMRKFLQEPLPDKKLAEFDKFLRTRDLPFGAQCGYIVVPKEDFDQSYGGMFLVSAPYYLVFRGADDKEARMNAGYLGELFCLKAAEDDIGTCWLGSARDKSKDDLIIVIAFGAIKESFRTSAEQFNRRPLATLVSGAAQDISFHGEALELARLAPSAMNRQSLSYCVTGNRIFVLRKNPALKFLGRLGEIDSGIALAHLLLDPKYFVSAKDAYEKKGFISDYAVERKR